MTRADLNSGGADEGSMVPSTLTDSTLSAREVAYFLNIHVDTVRRWSDQGVLKSFCIGPRGDRRFRREEVLTFLPPQDRSQHREHR